MSEDARFEDGIEAPLNIGALGAGWGFPVVRNEVCRERASLCDPAQPLPLGRGWQAHARARSIVAAVRTRT